MHGKGPIYVQLHCTVMARRAPLLFAQIFLSLKTYFITIKNIVSEEEMKIIVESPVFLNYLSSVFVLALLLSFVRRQMVMIQPKLRKPKNHANPCKKTMHILTGVSAPSAIYF